LENIHLKSNAYKIKKSLENIFLNYFIFVVLEVGLRMAGSGGGKPVDLSGIGRRICALKRILRVGVLGNARGISGK